MIGKRLVWALLCLALAAGTAYAAEKEDTDLLNLSTGAVILRGGSVYNEKWHHLLLIDGVTKTGWCSAKGQAKSNAFIIELARTYQLKDFALDNSGNQERGYPGISAGDFELYASTTSASDGYKLVLKGRAARGARKLFRFAQPVTARWLKLKVLGNHGHRDYTELMELEAHGEPVGQAPAARTVDGIYATNYRLLRLAQKGAALSGCYDWDQGTLNGNSNGRVARFQWSENQGTQKGSAIMALSSDGRHLNGYWYEKGRYQGPWFGSLDTSGKQPKCRLAGGDPIGEALDKAGRVILYGIYFDTDKAVIKPESLETLNKVLAAIKKRPHLKIMIEGHTDSRASAAYNLKLSRARAAAVKAWLAGRGIAAARLGSKGLGESRPVASNQTPDGRALNRRVEIVAVK